ncbi:MAG: MotA/TolQ/ExbB proton channel family protein [Opitutaceae bacterium]|nr:MotA/TolQ/ExbB proton channel family protein [Opitutaceae bacterium]
MKLFLTLLPLVAAATLAADELDQAASQAEKQLADAVGQLATLRETIAAEKLPVAAELRQLDALLVEKRRERDRLERMRDNRGLELGALEEQLKVRTSELEWVGNMLNDYANRLNASLHPAEVDVYADQILPVLNLGENSSLTRLQKLEMQAAMIDLGLTRISENAGGHAFDGAAVQPDGRLVQGRFVLLGPTALFAAAEGSIAGLAERGSAGKPRVLDVFPEGASAIAALARTGSATIPIDSTLGRATALAATSETLMEHIMKGGIWMYPILGFAFIAFASALFKLLEISQFRLPPLSLVNEIVGHLAKDEPVEAERLAKSRGVACADLLVTGVRHARMPKELIDELLFEALLSIKPKLERGIAIIAVTASVAPLLGLLGTVTGMINTFKAITVFGTGDPKTLSGGISEALITTEYGLIVAIPTLLISAYLSRKANGLIGDIEKLSMNFVNGAAVLKEARVPTPVITEA